MTLRAARGRLARARLPKNNIDTGMGLERMAAVLQGVESVFETDCSPAADRRSPRSSPARATTRTPPRRGRCGSSPTTPRGRGFLIADGVVPSNEERGYVLRRVLRRAIQQGRTLGLEAPWLGAFAERTIEMMSGAYPQLVEASAGPSCAGSPPRRRASASTLERGTELLARLIAEAKESETSWIDAEDAFKLHDTYGFPYDLTRELLAERGPLGRRRRLRGADGRAARARPGRCARPSTADGHEAVLAFAPRGAAHELRRLRDARARRPASSRSRGRRAGRRW